MAKISIEEVKNRLNDAININNVNINVDENEEDMLTESAGDIKKSDEIEFINSINDNLYILKVNNSYVLSPADDTLEPIIGEFDEVPTDNSMPPCLQDWLNTYSNEVKYYQENEEELSSLYMDDLTGASEDSMHLVDLGLSVDWANMNLGANKPEEFGDFYAYGEMNTKEIYSWDTYKYMEKTSDSFKNIGNNIAKTVYDAAYVISNTMCVPNEDQWMELKQKCVFTEKTLNNIKGYEVKGPNGNTIFLPFCGCSYDGSTHDVQNICYYQTANMASVDSSCKAYKVGIKKANDFIVIKRRTGINIRPICTNENASLTAKSLNMKFVDLGLSVKWADRNVGASKEEEYGKFFAWGETTPKTTYTLDNYKYYIKSSEVVKDLGNSISKNISYDKAFYNDELMTIPTYEQFTELLEKCTFTKTTLNNINVYKVTGPNGNYIYLPLTGYKYDSTWASKNTGAYYSCSTNYSDSTNQYTEALELISDKTPVINHIRKRTGIPIRPCGSKEKLVNKKLVLPLIPFKWGQGSPFNYLFPKDPTTNKNVITGCTQTALAQIVAYYGCIGINGKKYRRGCGSISGYTSNKGTKYAITMPALPPISMFNYDAMNCNKPADFKTVESKKAVSQLLQYLGYANRASYTSNGTSASPATAMTTAKNKLHLGSSPELIYASSGVEEFKERIYNELVQGYPVHFSGWNSKGAGGHSFVCDGYNPESDKFHFNFGWSGMYDGWFSISVLKPTSEDDFSYKKRAIVGLHPEYIFGDLNSDDNINAKDVLAMVQAIIDKKEYDHKMDINSDLKVDEKDIEELLNYIIENKV